MGCLLWFIVLYALFYGGLKFAFLIFMLLIIIGAIVR